MKQIPNEVKKVLTENNEWVFATAADNLPNAVPIFFTEVTGDGKLLLGNVFMKVSLENIAKNPNAAVSVSGKGDGNLTGYQIKGKASYVTDDDTKKNLAAKAQGMGLVVKGVVVVEPEEIIVTSPGPDCGKTL